MIHIKQYSIICSNLVQERVIVASLVEKLIFDIHAWADKNLLDSKSSKQIVNTVFSLVIYWAQLLACWLIPREFNCMYHLHYNIL
jgi:hypothetical protein